MLTKAESELKFVKSRDLLPTVEVDIDCIPKELHGYGDLVANAISTIAAKYPKMRATIYVYQSPSVNFNYPQQTWSAFFGVAGDEKVLDVLHDAFQAVKIKNVRFSDYIDQSVGVKRFHVQGGVVWRPLEDGTWYSGSETLVADVAVIEHEKVADIAVIEHEEVADGENIRVSTPTRYRAARADATVGTIRKKIEEVFGLPEGSVALCGQDKKPLRRDATIGTLRNRWE